LDNLYLHYLPWMPEWWFPLRSFYSHPIVN
jgi:hypothetical protein